MNGVDAAGQPPAAAVKAAGYGWIGRYLAGEFAIAESEIVDATDEGIGIVSVWEVSSTAALGGLTRGRSDAQNAIQTAISVKQPSGSAGISGGAVAIIQGY